MKKVSKTQIRYMWKHIITFSWCPMRSDVVLTLSPKTSLKRDAEPKHIKTRKNAVRTQGCST